MKKKWYGEETHKERYIKDGLRLIKFLLSERNDFESRIGLNRRTPLLRSKNNILAILSWLVTTGDPFTFYNFKLINKCAAVVWGVPIEVKIMYVDFVERYTHYI